MNVKGIWTLMNWLSKLMYLNLIWILFSLPVVTILPSTFALIGVANKWVKGEEDTPKFSTFIQQFKEHFWKSYQFGITFLIVGLLLFVDLMIVSSQTEAFFMTIKYVLLFTIILYLVTILYSIPVYLNYQFSFLKSLFFGLMIGVREPVITVLLLLAIGLIVILFLFFTGFEILFVGSLPAFLTCKAVHFIINRLVAN